MKTTYVTLEQAEHLHKLKIDCTELITEGNAKAYGKKGEDVNFTTKQFHCWKPTLDYACKWLRENFNVHVTPHATWNMYGTIYMCTIFFIHKDKIHNILMKDEPLTIDCVPPQIFDTYELAQSAGFDYAIKLIAENKIKKFSEEEKEERLERIEKLKKEEKKRLDKALANIKDSKIFKKIKPKK